MLNTEQFAADFATLHASYERQAYPIIKRALDAQKRAVLEYVEKDPNNVLLLGLVLPSLIDSRHTESAYRELYETIGVRHARNYSRLLDRLLQPQKHGLPTLESKAISFSSEFWRRVMAEFFSTDAAGKVTNVDETTKERIRKVLEEAQVQNMTMVEMSKYIVAELKRPDFNRSRAMTIARTESTVAANVAADRVAQEASFQLEKGWSAAKDGRTRLSHAIVGRKEPIALEALFEVPSPSGIGVEYAKYPGASTLSAGNVISCRCSVYHRPKYDEDGLPIPK